MLLRFKRDCGLIPHFSVGQEFRVELVRQDAREIVVNFVGGLFGVTTFSHEEVELIDPVVPDEPIIVCMASR